MDKLGSSHFDIEIYPSKNGLYSYWFTGKPVYKLLFDSSNECIHECSVQFLPELYILF